MKRLRPGVKLDVITCKINVKYLCEIRNEINGMSQRKIFDSQNVKLPQISKNVALRVPLFFLQGMGWLGDLIEKT